MSKRIKFFLGHLAISIVVAIIIIGLVFFIWYPAPLAKAIGVTHIFLMLIAIDVIIGPLLTLLVYKEGKKTLKMDLSVIIFIQLIALGYGVFNITQGRPVWISYEHADKFDIVRANEIEQTGMHLADQKYKQMNWLSPTFISIKKETTVQAQNKRLFDDLSQGIMPVHYPERYTTLGQAKEGIQKYAKKLDELKKYNKEIEVLTILKQYPQADSWLPLRATAIDMVVLLNKQKAEVVKIVDLRPWN